MQEQETTQYTITERNNWEGETWGYVMDLTDDQHKQVEALYQSSKDSSYKLEKSKHSVEEITLNRKICTGYLPRLDRYRFKPFVFDNTETFDDVFYKAKGLLKFDHPYLSRQILPIETLKGLRFDEVKTGGSQILLHFLNKGGKSFGIALNKSSFWKNIEIDKHQIKSISLLAGKQIENVSMKRESIVDGFLVTLTFESDNVDHSIVFRNEKYIDPEGEEFSDKDQDWEFGIDLCVHFNEFN